MDNTPTAAQDIAPAARCPAYDTDLAARIARQVPGLTLTDVPRRFALCRYDEDDEPSLYLWGAQTATGAIGFLPDGKPMIESVSAERILALFGRVHALDLAWLDGPTEP